jgi:DCN1-like protein 1/2
MEYLQNIGISLDNASLFIVLEFLQAETVGEIKKEGFLKAWKEAEVDGTITAQRTYMKNLIFSMSVKPDVFKKAYRYTFVVGKEGDQRALSVENSVVYWDMLFKAPGRPWVGKQTGIDWLALWKTFLQEKWTRSVNRDMWNQTLEFALKSIDDETLSFWSEDGAWPGVIDEFVAWYREKTSSGAMDLDA